MSIKKEAIDAWSNEEESVLLIEETLTDYSLVYNVEVKNKWGDGFEFDCFDSKEASNLFITIRANMQGIPVKVAK